MDELNSNARALIDAGRGALRATDADRVRIEAALRARLGTVALPLDPGLAQAASAAGWHVLKKAALGVGLAGSVAIVALRPRGAAPEHESVRTSRQPAVEQPAELLPPATEDPSSSALAAPPPAKRPGAALNQSADRLGQEVALLSRATAALRTGQAAKALQSLEEHQRRFPRSALREDRRAAKAQALCLLGQVAKGRAELALLPQQSPVAARAKQVCEAGSLEAPAR